MHIEASRIATLMASVCLGLAVGCSDGPSTVTSSPHLVNPENVSRESGSTDDIYDAVQQAMSSLMRSDRVRKQPGNRVVLNKIVNLTGIPGYDENIIYNKFLSYLIQNGGDKLVFLNRESVAKERSLQAAGQVKTAGLDTPTGADMVLDVELRQLPGAKTQTIQYTFRLTNLASEIVWTNSFEIKKKT